MQLKSQQRPKQLKPISPTLAQADNLPDSACMRPKDAAQYLGISIASLWRLIAKQALKTRKLTARTTTITMGDLRTFIASKEGV